MFKLEFKAKVVTATRNGKDNYYMVGLADDKYDYKNYILFQRPIKLEKEDDPEADMNGIYAECNGDIAYNACKSAKITSKYVTFEIQDSIITVNIESAKINKRFIEYCKEIFRSLLIIES